jgi:tetratricopeptide (TPR) repeat protein
LDYEKAKKIRTAKRYYAKAIEKEKTFAKAYFRLAHLYMQDKKYDLAVNLYLDGLSLRKGTAKDWINLSLCYLMTSNLKAAEKVLKEALEIFPKSSEVLFALGTCYIKKRNYKKNAVIISKLEERGENEMVLSLRIKETLDRKQYEQLGELLKQLGKQEKTADYWYKQSIVEANTGNEKKAINCLRKAISYNPDLRKEALKDENFTIIRELVEFKHVVYPRK